MFSFDRLHENVEQIIIIKEVKTKEKRLGLVEYPHFSKKNFRRLRIFLNKCHVVVACGPAH